MSSSWNWELKISLAKPDKEIIWTIVGLSTAKAVGVSEKLLLILYTVWMCAIVIRSGRIIIPKVKGWWIYFTFIFVATIMGLISIPISLVEKDLYYFLPNLLVIWLGYVLACYEGNRKSILKTICFSGFLSSIIGFGKLVLHPTVLTNFSSLRETLSGNIYEVAVAVAIILYLRIIAKKILFSKRTDMMMLIVMMGHSLISMGRTQIVVVAAEICIMLIEALIIFNDKASKIKTIFSIAISISLITVVAIIVVPKDVSENLFDKFSNSMEEIDSENEFDSISDATENWRGYENQSAKKQWENYNLLEQLVGKGMGEGLYVKYVPYTWRNFKMISGNKIPLLHNGYYTTLIKGGLMGLICLIALFLDNILLVIGYKRYTKESRDLLIILSFITVGIMISTYVMRGIVAQGVCLYWSLLVGWINREVRKKRVSINKNIETKVNVETQKLERGA